MIDVEEVIGRGAARLKEKYYKSGIGKEFLKALSKNHHPVVQQIEYLPAVGREVSQTLDSSSILLEVNKKSSLLI